MRTIIGILIFWISIFGLKKLVEDKSKIKREYSLALTFTLIGIIMFLAGLLNIMQIVSILLVLLGIMYLCIAIKRKSIKLQDLKNIDTAIIIIMYIYVTIISLNMHITHYDNFSHWALIIKNMFIDNALPNFENTLIIFKGYQPGSACFIYFVGLVCGKTEPIMILGQTYLIFSYITILFAFVKNNCKLVKRLLIIAFYIFITTISIALNNLLVDTMIGVMTLASIGILYGYRNDIKKGFIYTLPISIYLLLVKNTGLILAGIICLYILYLAYKNKCLKKGIKYVIISAVVLLIFILLWQSHVSIVYGSKALNSKHSLSIENIISSLKSKGTKNILQFTKDYIYHFFTIKDNISNIYMIAINIVLIILVILNKNKKELLKLILVSNIIYIGYYIILGLMYLLSMPWGEAVVFAGYTRYMSTIIIIIIGIILFYLLQSESKNRLYNIIYILVCCLMILVTCNYPQNAKTLIGVDNYKGSKIEKYDRLITNISNDTNYKYYIYDPSSVKDGGFMHYLSVYKLNTKNFEIVTDIEKLEKINNGIMILFKDDINVRNYLQNNNWIERHPSYYTKE